MASTLNRTAWRVRAVSGRNPALDERPTADLSDRIVCSRHRADAGFGARRHSGRSAAPHSNRAQALLRLSPGGDVADKKDDDMTVVPFPGGESEAERQRIRKSNDRDQELERRGTPSRHDRGYDEAADGTSGTPEIERVVDE
jgi:hypothetical protein